MPACLSTTPFRMSKWTTHSVGIDTTLITHMLDPWPINLIRPSHRLCLILQTGRFEERSGFKAQLVRWAAGVVVLTAPYAHRLFITAGLTQMVMAIEDQAWGMLTLTGAWVACGQRFTADAWVKWDLALVKIKKSGTQPTTFDCWLLRMLFGVGTHPIPDDRVYMCNKGFRCWD